MNLTSNSIIDGEPIAADYALAEPADEGHVTFAGNMNPHLFWTDVPIGSRSFVITCIDLDAPTVGDDVNQEDREVPPDLERGEFTHWLLANLAPDVREIEEGSHSTAVTPSGKTADAAQLDLGPSFSKTELLDAMDGHVLGSASITGTYATNPRLSQ